MTTAPVRTLGAGPRRSRSTIEERDGVDDEIPPVTRGEPLADFSSDDAEDWSGTGTTGTEF